MRKLFLSLLALALSACGSSTSVVGSLVLPTSNRTIDVVQHRSDSRGCAELVVLQTFDATGGLIDSKEGRATALPCALATTIIESGSRVGAAAIISRGMVNAARAQRPDSISVENSQTQGQRQGQAQHSINVNTNSNRNRWTNENSGGHGGSGGHGNNGGGNGDGDGTNPGTDNHHNNGDND